ncbi:extracellular solute-binding protein [Brevundimonas sp. 2R-24]|uniref:Extracellular solute-binding protein n=1 Tax=Peiella sedimenti TaxID=3061083 RepID=A0ABT8SPZ6_9CAUL|nr:extracellular solute-binding protein [Caulobacteraceae bacterium XZ-24]
MPLARLFNRRLTIGLGLAAMLSLPLAACQGEDGKRDDAPADAGVVNLYTARHYDSDLQVYEAFTEATGIRVRRIEMPASEMIERLRAEGDASPADVIVIADAGAMGRAAEAGLLQPAASDDLVSRVPQNFRDPQNRWFGFTRRARVVAYDSAKVRPEEIDTYEELASPRFRGKLCVRNSDNPYNISLLSALIEHWGPERATEWARGVVANMARPPQGGDTDQIRAVGAGQCEVAITNSYYFLRMAGSENAADREIMQGVRLGFPSLDGRGSHNNVSAAGLAANAPNRANAIRFMEFLTEAQAQGVFAEVTNEFPTAEGAAVPERMRDYAARPVDPLPMSAYGPRQAEAQRIFEAVGWR